MRVLVVRLGSMGDVIHALPAVAALRAAHPDAHIGWAIERRWAPLLVADGYPLGGRPTLTDVGRVGEQESGSRSPQRPLVDSVHVVNTLGWRRTPFSGATWGEVRRAFRDIRADKYDVAIDFQGSIKSAVVARFSGAPTRIGFAQAREKQATMFYTSRVQTDAGHVIDQNLALVSNLLRDLPQSEIRNPQSSIPLRSFASFAVGLIPSDPAAAAEVDRKLAGFNSSRFAILTPGAGWGAKQWPTARFGEVARALADEGVTPVINYAPAEEPLARAVEQASDGAAKPVLCTIAELIALTRRAALFIGGDTGPMHMANALGVPVVALFGPTDPARNGPYAAPGWGKSIVLRHPSSRNDMRHRPDPNPGLLAITADEVIAAMRTLLDSAPDSRHPSPDSASRAPLPTPRDPEAPR